MFEAWGEIFTVPTDKGDIRNITRSPAVADRNPAWSPDGKSIAYFSDASGEYELHIRGQNGMGEARRISLGTPPSFFYDPRWSPDSRKIAYADKRIGLWYVDVADAASPVAIDENYFGGFGTHGFTPVLVAGQPVGRLLEEPAQRAARRVRVFARAGQGASR